MCSGPLIASQSGNVMFVLVLHQSSRLRCARYLTQLLSARFWSVVDAKLFGSDASKSVKYR